LNEDSILAVETTVAKDWSNP